RDVFGLQIAPKIAIIKYKKMFLHVFCRIPNPGAAGSNPAWSTIKIKGLTGGFNWLAPFVFAICSTCD
ncbi:MAG: hypothetical protein PHI97_32365, partial [Desulfobulbus sp.]|nr:hypothetical protein [Desulfobulbus sp.]